MGLPQDPGRTAEARHPCLRHVDPVGPTPRRPRPRSSPRRPIVERVPQSPGSWDRGHGLLRCGDGVASHDVRAVRDRTWVPPGAPPRRHQGPGLGVGDPAAPKPRGGGAASRRPVPDPRRDSKFSGPFDEVFRAEGVRVVKTPIRAPKANAFAERWVRTARRECLDHLLILGRRHLERVLGEFADHYNAERPHRGLRLARPSPPTSSSLLTTAAVRRRDRLGGMIHEYHREVA